jgi:hypothetical protein
MNNMRSTPIEVVGVKNEVVSMTINGITPSQSRMKNFQAGNSIDE